MKPAHRLALRIALGYGFAGAVWILVSDQALLLLGPDAQRILELGSVKGLLFVTVSSLLLYYFSHLQFERRERLHNALHEERERFRLLVEGVADYAIFLIDPEGRVTTWNAGAERVQGWRSADALGQRLESFYPPEDRASGRPAEALAAAAREGRFSEEGLRVRQDGTLYWANMQLTALHNADGSLRGFANVTRDVTARKQAEADLAANAAQYRLLFASNPQPMLVYDIDSLAILAVNEAIVQHYGYSRAEFLAMTIRDIRPPEDIPRLMETVAALRSGQTTSPVRRAGVWRHRRKDGSQIFVEVASTTVDFEGRRAALVLANDVTARRTTESALEESRARLAGIIDSAMDAIITTDSQQRIVLFNRAAEAMFGAPAAEVLGQSMSMLIPDRFRQQHDFWVTKHGAESATSRRVGGLGGIVCRRRDGEEFPAEASISTVETSSGRFFTVILRDITERQRAEDELTQNRQRLQIAIETAHIGFWDWEIATNRAYFSPEWKRHLGLENDPAGDDPDEYRRRIHPDDADRVARLREKWFAGESNSIEFEFRALHKDGGYRDLRVNSVLWRDAEGRPARVIGTKIDLTPIRDAERTVRRLSAHILRLQDMERRRIARELHDTTAQNLAAMNMNLARLGRALATEQSAHLALVDDSVALADLCVQEIRTLSYLLHPPLLDEFGLGRAVLDYAAGFASRSGIRVEVDADAAIGRLPDEVELSLFRVLQESLGNVHRHSGGNYAQVSLTRTATEVVLEISDNGRGMPAGSAERLQNKSSFGVGITGMTERLEQLGGSLEISSNGQGTSVRAHVPRHS